LKSIVMAMVLVKAITGVFSVVLTCMVVGNAGYLAETVDHAPVPEKSTKREPKKSAAGLEARHRDCLAFIQRHGQSCDPWETPTCGHVIGYVRPMSCVAP
jgi:hypothetical protein